MKKIILTLCILIPVCSFGQGSFNTLSNPHKKYIIADETTYQLINGRKAIIVTYNEQVFNLIKSMAYKIKCRKGKHVLFVHQCKSDFISILK